MEEKVENGIKNGENTRFSSKNQPSVESKKSGWARKKQAESFMNKVTDYLDMSLDEFERLETEMSKNKDRYTVRETIALNYTNKIMKTDKFILHWLDLLIPKATQIDLKEEYIQSEKRQEIVLVIGDNDSNK